jgi:hypothetical protein
VGTAGALAMVSWNGHDPSEPEYESRFQVLDGVVPVGDAARIFSTPAWGTRGPRALAPTETGWWAGVATSCGIESMTVAADGHVDRRILVPNVPPECHPFCDGAPPFYPSFTDLTAVSWGDELWLGFWDWSNAASGAGATQPYRVVRVKEGCRYRTAYDAEGPGSR